MADSRRASSRHLRQIKRVMAYQTQVIYFLLSLIGAFLLTYWLRSPDFTSAQDYVLFLLFFSVGLWVSEAIPPFAVGILIVGFLVFFLGSVAEGGAGRGDDINVEKFVSTWSNSVIWLILGGFFLAEGMSKTGVDRDVFRFTVTRLGSSPDRILLSVMLSTCLASMLMSNTATTAMMLAATAPILGSLGRQHDFTKAILLSIPIAATLGGMGTIIGSPPNAIAVDAINNSGALPFHIGFLEWMLFGTPIALLLTFVMWRLLLRRYPSPNLVIDIQALLHPPTPASTEEEEPDPLEQVETRVRKRIVTITMLFTLLLWLTGRLHGIPPAAVSGIPIIVFTMVSITTSDDVRTLPWDTLMLVAGGLSLGLAIQETGLSEYFIAKLQSLSISPLWMIPLFALVTVVLSNIMSNTATATILIPIASLWPGLDPAMLAVIIGLAASCALFLPVSTPPNAIVYSTGLLPQQAFHYGGGIIGLLGPIIIITWVWLVFILLG